MGESTASRRLLARRWIAEGDALRDAGLASIRQSMAYYDAAIRHLEHDAFASAGPSYWDDLASAWTNQGIGWLKIDTPAALQKALACFDRGISLREPLVPGSNSWFGYNLAGVWLNRGDALLRLGSDPDSILQAYDRAVAILGRLSAEASPCFFSRLALAWFNRANASLCLDGASSAPDAVAAFSEAIVVAEGCPDPEAVARLLPSAWAGKADALSRIGSWEQAWAAAHRAIALVARVEDRSAESAMVGLRCRLTLCLFAARFLDSACQASAHRRRIAEAIDAAEAGLRLAARWRDEPRLAPLVRRLFHMAAEAYASVQPHLLVEFLDDTLPQAEAAAGAGEARKIAARALATGIGQAARDAFADLNGPRIERTLANFRQLREAAAALHASEAPLAGHPSAELSVAG